MKKQLCTVLMFVFVMSMGVQAQTKNTQTIGATPEKVESILLFGVGLYMPSGDGEVKGDGWSQKGSLDSGGVFGVSYAYPITKIPVGSTNMDVYVEPSLRSQSTSGKSVKADFYSLGINAMGRIPYEKLYFTGAAGLTYNTGTLKGKADGSEFGSKDFSGIGFHIEGGVQTKIEKVLLGFNLRYSIFNASAEKEVTGYGNTKAEAGLGGLSMMVQAGTTF